MKNVMIKENEKGILYKDGKLAGLLGAGSYRLSKRKTVEILPIETRIVSENCTVERLLENAEIAAETVTVEVGEDQMALHYVDGKLNGTLTCGNYAYWKAFGKHEFRMINLSDPEVPSDIPASVVAKLSPTRYQEINVAEFQRAKLCYDNKFIRLLEPGRYYFWRGGVNVTVEYIDTRLTQMNVMGQELLTQDKVELRVSFVCTYRVTDCVRVTGEIDDYMEQMHVAVQLALREYVGKYRLDEILENKDEMTGFVLGRLRAKCAELYVEVTDAGVKDIILPGEIRSIMNTVLVAEKRAQANVITRREEVASTRSLLNTAKLMDENATLYKLKELEYVEKICENVGSINLNGNSDLLTQLIGALGSRHTGA